MDWTLTILIAVATTASPALHERPCLRRPVALVALDGGERLCVANRRSGTISVIDTASRKTIAEVTASESLADLAVIPGGRWLVAVDEAAHELLVLAWDGERPRVTSRVGVRPFPVSVEVSRDGQRCYVASLWSRSLTILRLPPQIEASAAMPRVLRTIDLPFAPRNQLLLRDDSKLIVADAFGGRFAVIDVARGQIDHLRELPAHNIRGLAVSADRQWLLVSHQILNHLARTNRNDVHWGVVMANILRSLDLEKILTGADNLLLGSGFSQFGDAGDAGGDPAQVVVDRDGRIIVALAGVSEVAVAARADAPFRRQAVGTRPTAVLPDPRGARVYVANTFSDTISVVDLDGAAAPVRIALGPRPEPGPVERGEQLFFDAHLSLDNWFSCHSCHTDGHTTGLLNDNLGDGSFGAPKRIPTLLGVGKTAPWAWNGTVKRLEDQVRRSVRTTMQGAPPTASQVADLVAYLRSLVPPPPRRLPDPVAAGRGRRVFQERECDGCHVPPTYTSRGVHDVGLIDEVGTRRFNAPSLRGVGQRDAFFHDSRAASLQDVLGIHAHQLETVLPAGDRRDLVEFLHRL